MKFLYEYRTSDNVRHEDVICAASREAAFAALKEKGIRPGRLHDAPGLFNKVFGRGKRWIAIALLSLAVLGTVAYALQLRRVVHESSFEPSAEYVELEHMAMKIVGEAGTNDVEKARRDVRELFRERYPNLSASQRERQEAQSLYGLIMLRLEAMEIE